MSHKYPVLIELATRLVEEWQGPEQTRRRKLWADHFAGRTTEIPVSCAMFQGGQDLVWQQILPEETFVQKEGMARVLEQHLRHRLWRIDNIPDDTPLDPIFTLNGLSPLAADELWGVPLAFEHTDTAGGAYKPNPPIKDLKDIEKLHAPEFKYDPDAVARQVEEVHDLVGDLLPIAVHCDALHNGPFEWAVRLRGMDNLLFDCYDNPQWLHEFMQFLSAAIVQYHQARQTQGITNPRVECGLHSPWYDGLDATPAIEPPCPEPAKGLGGSFGYLHAQSAASYSPAMYEEFVQPYNVPIARLFGKVYYHGCEDLSVKVNVIHDLPNLLEFHVSPWSKVAPIAQALPEHVVMEVHSHPTNVLLLWGEDEMREELQNLVSGAGEHLFNLKLCDIQTLNHDNGAALMSWSRIAKEVAEIAR